MPETALNAPFVTHIAGASLYPRNMSEVFQQGGQIVKEFSFFSLIKAHEAQEETASQKKGDWYVHAPIALTEQEDFDKHILSKAGVDAGLALHERMGGHIDYAHMYQKTKDLSYLVGRRVATPVIDGATNMVARLFKGKKNAQDIWEQLTEGGVLGFSLQGFCKALDPKNSKRVTAMDIYMVTIDAMPKGFEATRLHIGKPDVPHTMGEIMKSLSSELAAGDLRGWSTCPDLEKALTTGTGAPTTDSTGAEAVRKEPALRTIPDRWRCSACEAVNNIKRKSCRTCGLNRKLKTTEGTIRRAA